MFGSTKPLRTLHVYDHGSKYTILDTDDATLLYTVHWTPNSAPHMTVYRGEEASGSVAGTGTYHATKKLGFRTASNITLKLPSGTVSLNKEGGFFSTDKRTFRSASLGELYWKGGYSQVGFIKLVDGQAKNVVGYKPMRNGGKIGSMEIGIELGQEGLDEVVVSGMAMLSDSMTSMGASARAISMA